MSNQQSNPAPGSNKIMSEKVTFTNHYEHCNQLWSLHNCDSTHNDRCPVCNCEIEPYSSDIDATSAPMTEAFKKVQEYRDQMNNDKTRILADDLSSCVYVFTNAAGRPCAIGYRGRAKKPSFRYYYSTENIRNSRVAEWMIEQSKHKNERRKREERRLAVGDVLKSTWGYDQTNIDYYMVTLLIGKTMVELVEIGQHREYTGDMQGTCTPDPTNVIGKPIRRRVDGERVCINSVSNASKEEKIEKDGEMKFPSSTWTAYH